MAYAKDRPLHPILKEWVNARSDAGQTGRNARVIARRVSAMAYRLQIAPEYLPDNAPSLHFAGRETASAANYRQALTHFRRWLDSEKGIPSWAGRSPYLPGEGEDEDLAAWRTFMGRLSPRTVENCIGTLRRAAGYAGKRPRDLTHDDVQAYLLDRISRAQASKGQDSSGKYLNGERGRIHRFFEYLNRRARMEGVPGPVDPTDFLDRVDEKEKAIEPIPLSDLSALAMAAEAMADSPDPYTAAKGRRWLAAMTLMSENGFRISDVWAFRPSHIHQTDEGWKVYTRGKNHRDQAPVPIVCHDAVVAEFVTSGAWASNERILPPQWDPGRASREFINFADQCDIKTHAHALRHRYGTTYLLARGNTDNALMDLQRQMRHSSITTTMRYAHYVESAKRNAEISSVGTGLFGRTRSVRHPLDPARTGQGRYARTPQ